MIKIYYCSVTFSLVLLNILFIHLLLDIRKIPIKIILNKTDVVLTKPLFMTEEQKVNTSDLLNLTLEKYLEISINNIQQLYKVKNESSILINGIEMNLKTPILFLYLNFSYMDSFLYITINQNFN